MAVTEIRHEWTTDPNLPRELFKPGEPATLHIRFDRELSRIEAYELAQAVVGVHNRHEVARNFAASDPHHAVHLEDDVKAAMVTETLDIDEDGEPVTAILRHDDGTPLKDIDHPDVLPEIRQFTRTFSGTCGDCGRVLNAGADTRLPHHYVCPTLPAETDTYITFREKVCCEGDAVFCGRPT